jgi:hypothetical protein
MKRDPSSLGLYLNNGSNMRRVVGVPSYTAHGPCQEAPAGPTTCWWEEELVAEEERSLLATSLQRSEYISCIVASLGWRHAAPPATALQQRE